MPGITKREKPDIRKQLAGFSTMDHLLEAFSSSKRIVFITGAGVSVSCGIPDFRSATGIYNTMKCQEIGIPSPELLFDLEFFLMDPNPFFKYAHNLMPTDRTPSVAHNFISLLESKKKLLRNYTQNIDGLERLSGQRKVIECHGCMDLFSCIECRKKCPRSEVYATVMSGKVPHCVHCGGVMKPMITFFGERSPPAVSKFVKEDMQRCDLIVVMGTSLKVGGAVVELLGHARKEVPQVLINLSPITPPSVLASEGFDLSLLGSCDDVVTYISDMIQIHQDQKELKMKKSLLEKMRKKVCKYCKGTRVLSIQSTAPPVIAPLPRLLPDEEASLSIQASSTEPASTEGRRVRKPSQKMIESSASIAPRGAKTNKTKGVQGREMAKRGEVVEPEMEECIHCKQDMAAADALGAALLPSSSLKCTPMEDARQFSISSGNNTTEVKETSQKEEDQKKTEDAKLQATTKSVRNSKAVKKRPRGATGAGARARGVAAGPPLYPPSKKKRGQPKK